MSDSITDFELEADRLGDLATQQTFRLDNQLHVQFYKHAELNSYRTREEGRKIFDEFVYVRIMAPANRLNVIERRASPEDIKRFAKQYAAFERGEEQLASGTPLSELTSLTSAQVAELKSLRVDTVEQLAKLSDNTAQVLGTGGPELKLRAQRFLARQTNADEQISRIAELEKQLAELLAERQASQAEKKDAVRVGATTVKA